MNHKENCKNKKLVYDNVSQGMMCPKCFNLIEEAGDKTMTMIELANIVPWQEVKRQYEFWHGKFPVKRVRAVFEKIKKYKVKKQKDKGDFVELFCDNSHMDNLRWGSKPEKEYHEYWSMATKMYSMSFRKWEEVANIQIDKNCLMNLPFSLLLSEFIWELTWYGDEKETQRTAKKLAKSVSNIKKNPKKYTKPFDLTK